MQNKYNYHNIDTCITCKFHYEFTDWDSPTDYCCNYGLSHRAGFNLRRRVEENGICDKFDKEEE